MSDRNKIEEHIEELKRIADDKRIRDIETIRVLVAPMINPLPLEVLCSALEIGKFASKKVNIILSDYFDLTLPVLGKYGKNMRIGVDARAYNLETNTRIFTICAKLLAHELGVDVEFERLSTYIHELRKDPKFEHLVGRISLELADRLKRKVGGGLREEVLYTILHPYNVESLAACHAIATRLRKESVVVLVRQTAYNLFFEDKKGIVTKYARGMYGEIKYISLPELLSVNRYTLSILMHYYPLKLKDRTQFGELLKDIAKQIPLDIKGEFKIFADFFAKVLEDAGVIEDIQELGEDGEDGIGKFRKCCEKLMSKISIVDFYSNSKEFKKLHSDLINEA